MTAFPNQEVPANGAKSCTPISFWKLTEVSLIWSKAGTLVLVNACQAAEDKIVSAVCTAWKRYARCSLRGVKDCRRKVHPPPHPCAQKRREMKSAKGRLASRTSLEAAAQVFALANAHPLYARCQTLRQMSVALLCTGRQDCVTVRMRSCKTHVMTFWCLTGCNVWATRFGLNWIDWIASSQILKSWSRYHLDQVSDRVRNRMSGFQTPKFLNGVISCV